MKTIKIVIVDDYRNDLLLLEKSLSMHPRLVVTGLYTGIQDFFIALQDPEYHNTFDILLLDVNMPIMNGIAALEILMQETWKFKIVMISHGFSFSNKAKISELGCDHYCSKDPESLRLMLPLIMEGEIAFDYHYTNAQWRDRSRKENLAARDEIC